MNPRPHRPSASKFKAIALIVVVAGLSAGGWLASRHGGLRANRQPVVQVQSAAMTNSPSQNLPANSAKASSVAAGVLPNFPDFRERPLPVAYENPKYQWTLENGKDTNVIRQLAHNTLEYQRMVDENARIFRRQLVYLKETAASVFEQAKLTGQPVRELTLPGIDQEMEFEIVKSAGNAGSSRQGMYSGHLVSNSDSLVTLAFQDGREAFTVLSPKDNLFVVGEPREPGQVIVKAIDPNTYGMGPEEQASDSITTTPTKK